jgi:hypothetical protein
MPPSPARSDLTEARSGTRLVTQDRVIMEGLSPAAVLRVRIADVGVALATADAALSAALEQHYTGFRAETAAPELRIRVEPAPSLRSKAPVPELEGQPWLDVTPNYGGFRIRRLDFDGEIDFERGTGELRCWPRVLAVDGFLRVCFSLLIIRSGGLLLHAASVVSGGRGHAFTGPSGAGKTTVCRLAGPRTILTDETTIVRPNGGGFLVHGNPFPGELGRFGPNAAFPLASVNLLVKDTAARISTLPPDEAVGALLANTFLHTRGSELAARALDNACAIAGAVPVRRLRFAPEPSFWEVIE